MIVGFVASAVAGAIVYATVVGDPPPEVAPIELREPRGARTEGPRKTSKSRKKKEEGRKRAGPAPTQPASDDDGTSGPAPVQPVPAPAGGGDDDDDDDDDYEPNTDD